MANPLFILESVGLAVETLKFAEAEKNYFLRLRHGRLSECNGGGGDVVTVKDPAPGGQPLVNGPSRHHHDEEAAGAAGVGRGERSPSNKKNQNKETNKLPPPSSSCPAATFVGSTTPGSNECFSLTSLSQQVANARELILSSLNAPSSSTSTPSLRYLTPEEEAMLREENARLKKQLDELQKQMKELTTRVTKLESGGGGGGPKGDAPKKQEKPADDDDVDLFGSDEEDDGEAARIKEERIKAYAEKKSKKPGVIAKSNVILDVKPWDDETDMGEMEKKVRSIVMDGLLWGASKLVPVGYGIKKLQISCVVEDDKVSIDELSELIEAFEDYVQSIDVAAFNKI